jgi:hypothetical protein
MKKILMTGLLLAPLFSLQACSWCCCGTTSADKLLLLLAGGEAQSDANGMQFVSAESQAQ